MLLQSLRALCLAPGGSGSVWKYLEALVRSPGVSGRIACGFRTELHFADEVDVVFWRFLLLSGKEDSRLCFCFFMLRKKRGGNMYGICHGR